MEYEAHGFPFWRCGGEREERERERERERETERQGGFIRIVEGIPRSVIVVETGDVMQRL